MTTTRLAASVMGAIAASLLLAAVARAQELTVRQAGKPDVHLDAAAISAIASDTVRVSPHHGEAATYRVVSLRDLLSHAGFPFDSIRGPALAKVVVAIARDGYRVAYSVGELDAALGNAGVFFAYQRNGAPLAADEGPFRLLVPGDAKQGRWIRQLERLDIVDAEAK